MYSYKHPTITRDIYIQNIQPPYIYARCNFATHNQMCVCAVYFFLYIRGREHEREEKISDNVNLLWGVFSKK